METKNSLPNMCELKVRIEKSTDQDGEISCIAEFRLYKEDLELDNVTCEVSISRAVISVDVEGLAVVPETRFGEPQKPNSTSITKTSSKTNRAEKTYQLGGAADVDVVNSTLGVGVSGSAGVKGSTQTEARLESIEVCDHQRVRAIPNLKWEVSEPDECILNGTYLNNDLLIKFTKLPRANRLTVSANVTVRQRDVSISQLREGIRAIKFFDRFNKTQRRLLDIFITKSLSSALNRDGKYRGEIKLSESIGEIENET